jgi:hypothetical protein
LIGSGILALIVIIVIVVVVVNSSSTNSSSPPVIMSPTRIPSYAVASSPTPTLPGQANSALGRSYAITQDGVPAATVTITAVRVTTTAGDQSGTTPENGYFAIATITVAIMPNFNNYFYIGSDNFQDLVNGFHVSEGEGNAYAALANSANELDHDVALGAGQEITKKLLFDVPSKHGAILYGPGLGSVIAQWKY